MTLPGRAAELALIGAGPTAASLLERALASAPELLAGRPLRIHLIDPHPAGTGRVWRPDLDPLLWMNSMAEDVTMFPDATVRCDGPVREGPTLLEWARQVDDATLAELAPPELAAEIRSLDGMAFPTRRVQTAYLAWFLRHLLAERPEGVEVVVHATEAVDLVDAAGAEGGAGRQLITLAGEPEPLAVDAVVLALGHLDAEPDPTNRAWAAFARAHGLVHLAPGHTADLDLSGLAPGADVLVTGFGQAFTDLVALVTEGRGGRFVPAGDPADPERLRYEPSGREPVLHVGSRRGVPYRSKLSYRLPAPMAPLPRFLDEATITALLERPGDPLTFRADVRPLVLKEVAWAWYHQLFHAHPERTTTSWSEFDAAYAAHPWGPDLEAVVAAAVPDEADRFEIERLNRPLDGLRFATRAELEAHLQRHVAGDVARRTDPAHSADLAAFNALLVTFGTVGRIAASGRMTARSRVEDVAVGWFSFFMYYASGPPPARLRQLLALAEAGVVRFVGAGMTVTADEARGRFVATSTSHPEPVEAAALVDARIAPATVSRSRSALLRRLAERGEVSEEVVRDGAWEANTGRLLVTGPGNQVRRTDGTGHPRRHAVGLWTNRPAGGTFARPRTNALIFRQHDAVVRAALASLAPVVAAAATPAAGG